MSKSRRVICVAGARPNFVKIKPVIDGLRAYGAEAILVHTGQHYDRALSDVFFDDLGIDKPDFVLNVGSASHAEQTARVMMGFEPIVKDTSPDAVVVVGDVNSTVACALVSAKSGVRLAHVEAGLRSEDWSMPEEVNRVLTDRASDLLLTPSDDASQRLAAEGYRSDQIHLVGNTMVDSLLANRQRAAARPILADLGLSKASYGLITLHRPSNVDDPEHFARLLSALNEVGASCPLVFPVHPRVKATLDRLPPMRNIRAIPPVGYLDFLRLEEAAALVLTDSGGVQEETTALGVPCLTLRESTERPITVSEGTNQVVGIEPQRIVEAALSVLTNGVEARCPAIWDGKAGDRVAQVMTAAETYRMPRPTERL